MEPLKAAIKPCNGLQNICQRWKGFPTNAARQGLNPPPNGIKFFSTTEVMETTEDRVQPGITSVKVVPNAWFLFRGKIEFSVGGPSKRSLM
jgi:hypothetical protein